jgi:outer membrane receptor for ferrienterochelin and colicins
VLGLAFEHDGLSARAVPGLSYSYNAPALFAQNEFTATAWITVAGSARIDAHNRYGTFFSSRLSALLRQPGSNWSLRASVGNGFAAPTPFLDEVQTVGLGALLPIQNLHAERAITASLDAKWADAGWDINASVFESEVRDPLGIAEVSQSQLTLINNPGTRRALGVEAVIGYVAAPLHVIASFSHINVTEVVPPGLRRGAPLVPRNTGELAAIVESEKRGRIGLELGYTGTQDLAENPYRRTSRAYFELNALGEVRFGRTAIFLNAINLTDVRQTHFDPLLRVDLGPGGNPITDAWAPLEGRIFNLGVRVEL